jgi:WS/DGAT/MGAT family acyltransferase
VDAPTFDLTHHVRELRLEPPAGEAELLAAVEAILRQRLDPGRPLWEMWLLPGLPDRRVGLFVRMHHAIADGMAAMATLASLLETAPDLPPVTAPVWAPAPCPPARALLADNLARRLRPLGRGLAALARPRATLRGIHAAWPAIREVVAEEPATRTSLDRPVGPGRRLALIRTSLAEVKKVGRAHDATVNDILLAATAAGLRALLQRRDEPVEATTFRIYVPMSLRRHLHGPQHGNLIAQMAVPLDLGEADPVRRLTEVAAETRERKARLRTSMSNLVIGGAVGRRLMLPLFMRQRVNATSASIPGPKEPLYLAGARILEVFPLLPIVANEPLAVGALSYAGALTMGITADRDGLPDLDILVGGMRKELEALGVPTSAALAQRVRSMTAKPPAAGQTRPRPVAGCRA